MGLAEHHPEKLYKKNRGVLKMGKSELSKFASTKEKGLVESYKKFTKKRNKKSKRRRKKKL